MLWRTGVSFIGISTSEYKNGTDDEFLAISFPVALNEDSLRPDRLTYMVLGEQLVATELHLGLKIYYGEYNSSLSLIELLNCAELLYEGVFGVVLGKEVKAAILKSRNYTFSNTLSTIKVEKLIWLNQDQGYGMDFKITHHRHKPA